MKKITRHYSFALLTIMAIGSALLEYFKGEPFLSGIIINCSLIAFFWYWGARARSRTIISGEILILLSIAGNAFGLFNLEFAGVTYDTYVHILAAFTAMMLAYEYLEGRREWQRMLFSALIVLALGLGVEVVEFAIAFKSGMPGCFSSFCYYWQDTVKDIINDILGVALFLLAQPRRILPEKKKNNSVRPKKE